MVAGLKPYVERMAKTDDSGKATFSNLPDGSYYDVLSEIAFSSHLVISTNYLS
jgi:hypothetical protein